MNFSTPITIERSASSINYEDNILMLGSCFTDNIAAKMRQHFFRVCSNPTGTLYNPVSIARHLGKADVYIITFGTAWVYIDRQTQQVVDNCQKRPADEFIRQRLTINDILALWTPLLQENDTQRFIFTVSPIRHIKDGLHENQLSKGILLQATDELVKTDPTRLTYFPAYEILMDELRDYRFYAADMLHPSETAVDYIWERFVQTYLYQPTTQKTMHELHQLWLDRHHRPLHPESDEYKQFRLLLDKRQEALMQRYPWIEQQIKDEAV